MLLASELNRLLLKRAGKGNATLAIGRPHVTLVARFNNASTILTAHNVDVGNGAAVPTTVAAPLPVSRFIHTSTTRLKVSFHIDAVITIGGRQRTSGIGTVKGTSPLVLPLASRFADDASPVDRAADGWRIWAAVVVTLFALILLGVKLWGGGTSGTCTARI